MGIHCSLHVESQYGCKDADNMAHFCTKEIE